MNNSASAKRQDEVAPRGAAIEADLKEVGYGG
jgi:hypothetical protein